MTSKDYFDPYGFDIPSYNQRASNTHKFTGHERDQNTNYDYMHARFYASSIGRLLRPDPEMKSARCGNPQSWNRYSYVENNPLVYIDPTGEVITFSGDYSKVEINNIIEDLNAFTGNQYAVNEQNQLVLVKEGENCSKTATDFFNTLISSSRNYSIVRTEGKTRWNENKNSVELNPKMFEGTKYPRGFNSLAMGLGAALTHELFHLYTGIRDRAPSGEFILNTGWTGEAVDFVNQIRKERNLPLRESYIADPGTKPGTFRLRFVRVNPSKPGKIYYVIMSEYWNK